MPYIIGSFVFAMTSDDRIEPGVGNVIAYLAALGSSNSILNCVIYFIMDKKIRGLVKGKIACRC